jgi:hypothetical protein
MIKFFLYIKDKIRMIKYVYKANKRMEAYFKALDKDRIQKAKEREKAFIFPEGKDIFEDIKAMND